MQDLTLFSTFAERTLPDGISLQMLSAAGEVLYETSGKWLHPLFALEHFLETHPQHDPSTCFLHDRIAGKAAAALTVRLGFKFVKADMISSLALGFYEESGVTAFYTVKVETIQCMTEKLLEDIDDTEEIYSLIEKRRALGRKRD